MNFDVIFFILFVVMGILFRRGKCKEWVLGAQGKGDPCYNEAVSLRFFSNLMFALAVCSAVMCAAYFLQNTTLRMAGYGLNCVVLVGGLVYFYTNKKKFRRNR